MNALAAPFPAERTEAPRTIVVAALRCGNGACSTGSCLGAAWAAGLGLCLVTGAIVVYMGVRGFQYLRPDLLVSRPQIAEDGSVSGGSWTR